MTAFAGADADVPMTRQLRRSLFENERRQDFWGRMVLPAEISAKEFSSFSATDVVWTIAMPIDKGDRLRFVKATFRKGRFVSGTMFYMGLPEVNLSADDFSALQDNFPMLAVCGTKDSPACLFRPRKTELTKPVPEKQILSLQLDPLREIYGDGFLTAILRLGVLTKDICCCVIFSGPDGKRFSLGTVRIPRFAEQLEASAVLAAITEAGPDLVSEREKVEYYIQGSLAYEFVLPQEGREAGK